MAYIAQYKLWKWYDIVGIVWKQLWILSLIVPKLKWFALYHTNLSHKVSLSFVWLKFSSFWVRCRYEENKECQDPKLGDAPEGIPSFVSNIIGNLTWSYVFIRHLICVLASIYFVRICLMLSRIMFCIFYFNKSSNDSLCHAYFASIHVAVWKQEVHSCCKKFPRKVRIW